ncbi:MAG: citrate lyase holo-[Bacteroidales bacterium]|nr:citrate lyase holo-[acyl-carrier protein] synthase [Bacteroidales bacterium]
MEMSVSLEDLLKSRDERASTQMSLLAAYPGCSLVSLTVIFPGQVKRSKESLIVGGAAVAAILGRFSRQIKYSEVRDLETGYEAYFMVEAPAVELKRICCEIEETHPLGRLMDIDVLGADAVPLDRRFFGFSARKCLVCGQDARLCMRNTTHDLNELDNKIKQMIDAYV